MKNNPSDQRVKGTCYLEAYQTHSLKTLSAKTRIKQADFIREAVDDLILKYQGKLSEELTKNVKERLHKD